MRCIECDSNELLALISIEMALPLTQKGGSVIVAGEKFTQKDIKETWDKTHDKQGERLVRGPIICPECETKHVYIKGVQPSLYRMDYGGVKHMSMEEVLDYIESGGDAQEEEDV